MPIRFMSRNFILLLILIGIQPMVYAQLDTNQETFRIKALALDRKPLSEQFPLTLSPIVGLTDKGFEITMGIKPIDGFAKKKYGITKTRDVVDPTWEVKQQFSCNNDIHYLRFKLKKKMKLKDERRL